MVTVRLMKVLIQSAFLVVLAGCGIWDSGAGIIQIDSNPLMAPLISQTMTPFQPLIPTATPTPIAAPRLWVQDSVPSALVNKIILHDEVSLTDSAENADLRLEVVGDSIHSINWVYALVAPFPTVVDDVNLDDIQSAWQGKEVAIFDGRPLMMSASTMETFSVLWELPGDAHVEVVASDDILDLAWRDRPSWVIIPFEELEPRWKVLSVDGVSPLEKDLDILTYPLVVSYGLAGEPQVMQQLEYMQDKNTWVQLPSSNRDPNEMTVLVMTGVTALVRATAWKMERNGMTYPGEAIQDLLASADLTHISNEVSFSANCPSPNPVQRDLSFCSDPQYIELLEYIGTDIIELSGNHNLDWGKDAYISSLEMYRERGWSYFAGGMNLSEARTPLIIEHNGNRLAFLGCNYVGPGYAWATETSPGSASCGDYSWILSEISRLSAEGYLPLVTVQHNEFYSLTSPPYQKRDFLPLAEAGAVVVSGSQAHYPNPFAFANGHFVHYGLGNLFFDQMDSTNAAGIQREFVDRHVFYGGKHISTKILTFYLEDFSRPRLMTTGERAEFLREAFLASGW
jgi:hypothetical protein